MEEKDEIVRELLHQAIPLNPSPGSPYVTHAEFQATVKIIESKIENASLKTKQWVLVGVLSILISFGGGYVSLMNKLDRLSQALPLIAEKQNTRWPWVQGQQQRDIMQDEVLKKLDPRYDPLPYEPAPQ